VAGGKVAPPLRGRRPRRAGTFGYRVTQLVTQALAPIAVGFLRRPVVRSKGVFLRQVKSRGMAGTPATITFQGFVHPGIRRGKKLGMRVIQPGRPLV
jgi:hypothetical protein